MTESTVLDLAHISMQYSDTPLQKRYDANKVLSRGYAAVTGTEAGQDSGRRALRVAAHNHGYALHIKRANWVAIRKSLIVPGTFRKGHEMIVDSDDYVGRGFDLHITWAGCEIENLGNVAFMAGHYATKGSPTGKKKSSKNIKANQKYAAGIGDMAERLGRGDDLVFYGGDQNIVDEDNDTFFGEKLTTVWDELGKYPGTGHGNIDVLASYDRDKRVEAEYGRVLNDKKLLLHTDHFLVEAGFRVKHLS